MSGVYFRVFENLNTGEDDPARFKLEIYVNPGSLCHISSLESIEEHCIPIKLEQSFTQTLKLEDIDTFFKTILDQ